MKFASHQLYQKAFFGLGALLGFASISSSGLAGSFGVVMRVREAVAPSMKSGDVVKTYVDAIALLQCTNERNYTRTDIAANRATVYFCRKVDRLSIITEPHFWKRMEAALSKNEPEAKFDQIKQAVEQK